MAYKVFETSAPKRSRYIIIGKPAPLKYIKNFQPEFLSVCDIRKTFQSSEIGAIVFHSMPHHSQHLIKHIPHDKKIVWLGWGYDYYDNLLKNLYPKGLTLPKTAELFRALAHKKSIRERLHNKTLWEIARAIKRKISTWPRTSKNRKKTLLGRVDYFIPVLESEYEMAKADNPWLNAIYLPWNYGTVEDDFINSEPLYCTGENILVGNSAASENNHIETFEFIKENFHISTKRIFCPLSYGDPDYAQAVANTGRAYFGENFVPLMEFIDKQEYIKLLTTCGYVFMNHIRQQALGNICILMMAGAKIYLNSDNPLYSWLKQRGAYIELINRQGTGRKYLAPLSGIEKEKNRSIIFTHWNRNSQTRKTVDLVNAITR